MAVKTVFSDEDLGRIFNSYDLGEYRNMVPFTKGTVQTNLLVHTSHGKFVFRYYESRPKTSVLFETGLLVYLKDRQFSCPGPCRNRDDEIVGTFDDKPYAVFEYIQGDHPKSLNTTQQIDLIKHVAELHLLTKDYEPLHNSDRWNYNPDFCRKQAQTRAQDLDTEQAHDKAAWMFQALDALELPEELPRGVCHCDFDYTNLLFNGDRLAALLDFDDANHTYLLFDLVHLIEGYAWPHDGDFDICKARYVIEEYSVHRPLNEMEKRHLFDVFKLSILIDCLWFFTRGSMPEFFEKGKVDFLNGLGREGFCEVLFGD